MRNTKVKVFVVRHIGGYCSESFSFSQARQIARRLAAVGLKPVIHRCDVSACELFSLSQKVQRIRVFLPRPNAKLHQRKLEEDL